MALPPKLAKISRFAVLLIGFLLVGYIGYLVLAQYRTRTALQDAALKQLGFDIERRALALSYFFDEIEDDVSELAESRELVAYLENKALGMSMEYGLQSSLMMLGDLFDRIRQKEHLDDHLVFSRIVFVDASGRKLVDSRVDTVPEEKGRDWRKYLSPSRRTPSIGNEMSGKAPLAVVSVPAFVKGRYAGQVIGWVPCWLVYHYFIQGDTPSRYPVCLVFGNRYLHVPDAANDIILSRAIPPAMTAGQSYRFPLPPGSPHGTEAYAILAPAGETSFSLLAFLLPSEQLDFRSPRQLLYTTAGVALFILAGMFFFLRINMRNAVLTAHLEETTLREREVGEKNRQLADEIRERRAAEASLQRERDFVETLFETAQVILLVLDSQGRIVRFNQYMRELSGYDLEDVRGRDWFSSFLPEEEREGRHQLFQKIMGESMPHRAVCPIITRAGEKRDIEWQDKPLRDADGGLFGLLSVGQDITERKKLEAELIKREKLESLGILAGGIAHDFNNLLTAVLGNISVAKILANPSGELCQRLIDTELACKSAVGLTRQLLTFSKGGLPIRKPASLAEIIKESAGLALSGSRVRSEFSLAAGLWPVEVDAGQISQVFHNLFLNADQAMPGGGVLRVGCENLSRLPDDPLPLKEGRYVHVTITDQGTGIPREHMGKVFDPYFTTKEKGSGLGLASSFSIINNHEGLITVESEEGKGTSFHVYLPASDRQVTPEPAKSEPFPAGSGRILVMEDEDFVRHIIGVMLKKLGYHPGFTGDGEAAVAEYGAAMAAGRPYDAVIMDLTIAGGMGGVEAIQRLHDLDPHVRAVVSSGYSNDPVMSNFSDYGFKGVVKKPYTLEELDELLRMILAS